MARIRSIKPEFWHDPDLAADLTPEQRLLYIGLWNLCFDNWTMEYDPRNVKRELFGYDDSISTETVASWVDRIVESGRAVFFTHEGRTCLYLLKCAEHQQVNRPSKSPIPAPDSASLNEDSVSTHGALKPRARAQEQGAGSREQGAGSAPMPVGNFPKCMTSDSWAIEGGEYMSSAGQVLRAIEQRTGNLVSPHDGGIIAAAIKKRCPKGCKQDEPEKCALFAISKINKAGRLTTAAKWIGED